MPLHRSAATTCVYINQIEVGSLPVHQYHQLVAETRRDKRPYLRQAANYLARGWDLVVSWLKLVLWIGFAFLVLLVLASPSSVVDIIADVQQASANQIAHGVRKVLSR